MKTAKLIIWLLTFFSGVFDITAQELIEAKCYGGKQQLRMFINAEKVCL
jgi:hypothetical protein